MNAQTKLAIVQKFKIDLREFIERLEKPSRSGDYQCLCCGSLWYRNGWYPYCSACDRFLEALRAQGNEDAFRGALGQYILEISSDQPSSPQRIIELMLASKR